MRSSVEEISHYLRLNGSAPDAQLADRIADLSLRAPIVSRSAWTRDGDRVYLAGTIGSEFDAFQRRVAAVAAADGFIVQAIGAAEVERTMDEVEGEAAAAMGPGERLSPRRSPGYGDLPLTLNHDIVCRFEAFRRLGISVTDSMMLVPTKSVIAICEVTKK